MAVSTIFAEALSCHHEGRLIDAENLYKQVLAAQPEHPDALHNMGVLQMQCSNPAAAVPWFQAALNAHPENPQCWLSLAEALLGDDRVDEAQQVILTGRESGLAGAEVDHLEARVLQASLNKPDVARLQALSAAGDFEALGKTAAEQLAHFGELPILTWMMATALLGLGRKDEAVSWLEKRCADSSVGAVEWSALGAALKDLGRTEEGYCAYLKALELEPGNPDVLQQLGENLAHAGYIEDAWVWFSLGALVQAAQWSHWDALKSFFDQQGLDDEAKGLFAEARKTEHPPVGGDAARLLITLQSGLAGPIVNRRRRNGRTPSSAERNEVMDLVRTGKMSRLLEAGRLLAYRYPLDPFGWNVLGAALKQSGDLVSGLTALRLAAAASSEDPEPHTNLAAVFLSNDSFKGAELAARRALLIDDGSAKAHGVLGQALVGLGRQEEAVPHFRRALELNKNLSSIRSGLLFWMLFNPDFSPEEIAEEARRFGRNIQIGKSGRYGQWRVDPSPSRLRVGFVSGDLCRHTVGFFSQGLFENLDQERIELFAYSTHSGADVLTERIRPYFSQWREIDEGMSDKDAARLMHEDRLHVLVDMSGHTRHNRLPALAYKPAPVQATWLGYSGTTGVAQIDYYIGDPWLTPVSDESHFTERVWRLPDTLICLKEVDVGGAVALSCGSSPADKNGFITFGCFNKLSKISRPVVSTWSEILRAVPSSQLLLNAKELAYEKNKEKIIEIFVAHGIERDRLILRDWNRSRAEHLAMYQEVDIALDPFPYGGATTSIEGLWMGVPVLTLKGDRMVSRLGEGINRNMGLWDWIADDREDYVKRAVRFAEDVKALKELREHLRGRLEKSPLFDVARFARGFEDALWGMWKVYEKKS